MTQPLLAVSSVRKSFSGVEVLRGVQFEVEPGEILSLIGPNGAGKTTLFNIISGLVRPDAGQVVFAGDNIERENPYRRAQRGIGRTFQHPRLLPALTILENVMAGAFREGRDVAAAEVAALAWLDRVGLGTRAAATGGSLTLLQRKFSEIARAMVGGPKLLLLDELMAGLTPSELELSMQVIRDINAAGTTILLIEHVMTAVMALSNRVVVLADGRIIAAGAPDDIVSNEGVLRAYLGEDFRAYSA